jgi:hypothetical protein
VNLWAVVNLFNLNFMKRILFFFLGLAFVLTARAQTGGPDNTMAVTVNGKTWEGKAQRMRIPMGGARYMAIAGFSNKPETQTWVRIWHVGELKPGTYPIVAEDDVDKNYEKAAEKGVFALVDYSEEVKGGYHDGESWKGTVTITSVTPQSVEGTFEAQLKGIHFKRTVNPFNLTGAMERSMERKAMTGAGMGMLANGHPHDHDDTKRTKETDEITLTGGKFKAVWTGKDEK